MKSSCVLVNLSIETDFKLELKQPLRFQPHPLITRQLNAFVGGEGSFWVNNVVFDERWFGSCLVFGGYK
ncbi:hypothetical protein HanPI659440_Chr07g0254811 [Helianthus annuus]|nr:hypothetical protein HanPI659440_Chr07g0254811 [Helianthus annuus]